MSGSGTPGGTAVLDDLAARGLLDQCTDEPGLRTRLAEGPITLYCGIDPTADSLHVGSLLPVLALIRFAEHGHHVIPLIGGATGMVGDPSGRSDERNLLDATTLDHNRESLRAQIMGLLARVQGAQVTVVDNREWFEGMGVLEFLRDVGKLVPITDMLERSSVKTRLASQSGLSFTEFSYQLLQAHDFVHLRGAYDCELQVGGSDQYGNITAGIDMIRRRELGKSFGLVWPLFTRSDGSKFGKSVAGNVWLSAEKTSPYAFHQFFFNAEDADVRRLLLQFTLLPVASVDELVGRHSENPGLRVAQLALADELTTWVHGADVTAAVNRARAALFGGGALDGDAVAQLADEIPTLRVSSGELAEMMLGQVLINLGLVSSVSEARRLISGGGVSVDGVKATDGAAVLDGSRGWVLLAKGKRNHALVLVA